MEESTETGPAYQTTPGELTPARTTVDGVPVFWLHVPGPLRAMLMFRVGVIDETLPTRGITHLVEHLAMFLPMQRADIASRVNARVELHRTRFMATGTDHEIVTFLADVTSNLGALPFDRLDNEKKILRTEAANRTAGSAKNIWNFRFGARGPGVADYEEFGLRWLGPQPVADWSAANFTAGNAVLWLSGPPPQGLRLNLPSGPRRGVPVVTPLHFATPAVFQQGDRWVVLSMLAARGTALSVGAQILDRRLRERLRSEQSLAYEVHTGYLRLDAQVAEVTAFADSLAQNAAEAAEAMVAATRELAEHGPEPAELATAVAERRRATEDPDSALGRLEQASIEELEGLEPKTAAELDAEAEKLTPASVGDALRSAFVTSYLAVPTRVDVNVAGFMPLPPGNEKRITGSRVLAAYGSGHEDVLDYSDEGISLTSPDQFSIGMNWGDVAIALSWNDGLRTLIGSDGMGIRVVPAKWRNAGPLISKITTSVPTERWVSMDDPDALAAPQAKSAPKPAWMRLASLRRYLLAMLIVTDVLTGILTAFGLVGVTGGETDAGSVALFVFFTTVFALSISATIGVVVQSRWYRAVSIIVGLLMFFTVVGAIIGIPMMIVAARLPLRATSASST